MALQTQSADVFEIALASALHHGHDMIGIPKGFSGTGAQSPMEKCFQPSGTSQAFQGAFCMQAIDAAAGADSPVASQYFFTNIARIAAYAPFFHAPVRTKGHAAFGNLQITPTA